MSMAYHSQTDGKTEYMNQEIEQYLHTFCSYQQDNWIEWLTLAEFALNSRVHSSTGKAPFELIYGYIPEFRVSENLFSNVPTAEKRLKHLSKVQTDAITALECLAKQMKKYYNQSVSESPILNVRDKVYLKHETHP